MSLDWVSSWRALPPAEAELREAFWVLASMGRDDSRTAIIVRQRRYEELLFALPDVHPDTSTVAQARLRALAECTGADVVERPVWPLASAPFRASGVQG